MPENIDRILSSLARTLLSKLSSPATVSTLNKRQLPAVHSHPGRERALLRS